MRLRKNLKRTAAAALALGVAVSSAAPVASATYYVDISKGNVTITRETDNDGNVKTTVKVTDANGNEVEGGYTEKNNGDDDVIIQDKGTKDYSNTSGLSADDAPDADEPQERFRHHGSDPRGLRRARAFRPRNG